MRNFVLLVLAVYIPVSVHAQEVTLSKNGKALFDVVISEKATEKTKKNAEELVVYLNRMTKANFEIKPGTADKGIIAGTISDFPIPAVFKDV